MDALHNSIEYILLWKNVSVRTPTGHVIVSQVNGQIQSGQVCLLLGSSGAGKTTLLNVLAGRNISSKYLVSGEILLNGAARNSKRWRRNVGYVEQFDLLHEFLTPLEEVYFTSRLKRLNIPESQHSRDALELLSQFGLKQQANRVIATRFSGGEKKRISIAAELISDPPFLFLDEPTSGLDAFNSLLLLSGLCALAKKRSKCILLTVHQPRIEILRLVDCLMLMTDGKVIYFGQFSDCIAYFQKIGYPIPENANPIDYFIDLVTRDSQTEEFYQKSLLRIRRLQEAWEKTRRNLPTDVAIGTSELPQGARLSATNQLRVLLKREFRNELRNVPFHLARLFQLLIFFVVLGLAFMGISNDQRGVQNRLGILFFICINQVFNTFNPYLNAFPMERALIAKERSSDSYSGYAAFLAKLMVSWPLMLLSNICYLSGLYWIIGLKGNAYNFAVFVLIGLALVMFAQAIALAIGAAIPDFQVAHVVGPAVLVLFVIFSGGFLNPLTLPGYLIWLYWLSPIQYAYKALAQNEFIGSTFTSGQGEITFKTGEEVLYFYYLYYPGMWTCILIFIGMLIFVQLTGLLLLQRCTGPGKIM